MGIDVVELKKARHHSKNRPFIENVFTEKEILYFKSKKDPLPHIATTFAAKEAVFKALGTGWDDGKEVEITRNKKNKPNVTLKGKLKKLSKNKKIFVSLSYSSSFAVAVALVENKK
jgi:holo-[acyl-carrier protein] synthase